MLIERFGSAARDWIEAGCRLAVKHNHRHVTPFHLLAHVVDGKVESCTNWLTTAGVDLSKLEKASQVAIESVEKADEGAGPHSGVERRNAKKTPKHDRRK